MIRPFQWHKMPLQMVAAVATFVSAVAWMPLIGWVLHDRAAPDWVWNLYWGVAVLEVFAWFVYHLVDADGDGG